MPKTKRDDCDIIVMATTCHVFIYNVTSICFTYLRNTTLRVCVCACALPYTVLSAFASCHLCLRSFFLSIYTARFVGDASTFSILYFLCLSLLIMYKICITYDC